MWPTTGAKMIAMEEPYSKGGSWGMDDTDAQGHGWITTEISHANPPQKAQVGWPIPMLV